MAGEVMGNEVEGHGSMADEQAADFAALQAAARDGEPLPGEPEQVEQDLGEEWAMIPAVIGNALALALPELRQVYSEEACRAWGAAMVPVAAKYGWESGGIIGPEVGLLIASLPFVVGTVGAVKAKRAALELEAKKAPQQISQVRDEAARAPAVGVGTVQFGEVRQHEAA